MRGFFHFGMPSEDDDRRENWQNFHGAGVAPIPAIERRAEDVLTPIHRYVHMAEMRQRLVERMAAKPTE